MGSSFFSRRNQDVSKLFKRLDRKFYTFRNKKDEPKLNRLVFIFANLLVF